MAASHRHQTGLDRREWMQVGASGLLGIGLPSIIAGRAAAAPARRNASPKSVILIFLTGAPSHLDTFDLKPETPAEIRGEFRPIATNVPGVHISEHLPRLAARMNKLAIVRSMAHRENNHLVATHHVLTGYQQPGAFFDKIASRDDWPCYSAGLNCLRPRSDGVPSGVNLPTYLMEGPLLWPGQHAGFLGPRHDPWQIRQDPNLPTFGVENLRLTGLDGNQLRQRMSLVAEVDRQRAGLAAMAETRRLADQQERAISMLTSGQVARAFDIDQEPARTRERYGRHMFGQSMLLARRLVQAGVPVVQCNMGIVQNWDTHGANFTRLKNQLLPPLDQGAAALLDDLDATGMLDDTLVMILGEFGRTPKIQGDGRDHWAACFSAAFAGAGVRGGQVIGQSDRIGAYPATTPYSPDDLGATVYHVLGIDPASEVHDRQGRPAQLNRGEVMQVLFNGNG